MLLTKFLISFILYIIDTKADEPIMIKLHPNQIVNTFKSVISSDYLKELANDFAVKAANHLIDAIRDRGKQVSVDKSTPIEEKNLKADDNVLNEREILTLLEDPSPDGDNLDSLDISEERKEARKKKIPVIEMKKINGVYYRRLLGLI